MEGEIIAETLEKVASIRNLEDGPYGGTDIRIGADQIGEALRYPLPEEGPWRLGSILDFSIAQTAHQLTKGNLWLPSISQSTPIPMTKLKTLLAAKSIMSMDINSSHSNNGIPRGPFDIHKPPINPVPTYPALWAHEAERERCMELTPDSEAIVRHSDDPSIQAIIDEKAVKIWATATKAHISTDLQYNSQSLSVSSTTVDCIGGRAWPNLIFPEGVRAAWEKAHIVWANSTLGILCYWWNASRQQGGRGIISVTAVPLLSTLDLRRLSPAQLAAAARVFADHKHLPMLPVNQIHEDEHRAELDHRLLTEVLGLPASLCAGEDSPLALLRRKLAAEPSIHGGKKSKVVL